MVARQKKGKRHRLTGGASPGERCIQCAEVEKRQQREKRGVGMPTKEGICVTEKGSGRKEKEKKKGERGGKGVR